MEESDLDKMIKQVLNGQAGHEGGVMDFAANKSANKKGQQVVDEIQKHNLDTQKIAFVSVGGADGTELYYELEKTSASHGILIELDYGLAQQAREKIPSQEKKNKRIIVLEGDARNKIGTALSMIGSWNDAGDITYMVVTMFAVLHEFGSRGNKIQELNNFLGNFTNKDMSVLIIVREPCIPANLPPFVSLSARCQPSNLADLANDIRKYHSELMKLDEAKPFHRRTWMPARLAVETIYKLCNLRSYHYEKEEMVTAYSEKELLDTFNAVFEEGNVRHSSLQSDSFDHCWKEYELQISDNENKPIKPRPHLELIVNIPKAVDTSVRTQDSKPQQAPNEKLKGNLSCVLDGLHHGSHAFDLTINRWNCPGEDPKYSCLAVKYDYESVKKFPLKKEKGLRRYLPLLPINEVNYSQNEGGTPLLKYEHLNEELGIDDLYVKDEGRNPTASFKDRKSVININVAALTRAYPKTSIFELM